MVELTDRQQETEGELLFSSRLTLMPGFWFLAGTRCTFVSLKIHNLKVCM